MSRSWLAVRAFRMLPRRVSVFAIHQLSPKYVVGVQVFVRRPDGHVLLVQQTYRSMLFLPGGLVKRGEGALTAARRELREETGLDVEVVELGRAQVRERSRWITVYALAEVDVDTAASARACGAEISSLAWVDPHALPAVDPGVLAGFHHVSSAPTVLPGGFRPPLSRGSHGEPLAHQQAPGRH